MTRRQEIIVFLVPNNETVFQYANRDGKISTRRVFPQRIFYGTSGSDNYPGMDWWLHALDLDRGTAPRTFRLSKIQPIPHE